MKNKPYWTLEKLRQTASEFETVGEFRKVFPGAYQVAWKKGFLTKLGLTTTVPDHSNLNRKTPKRWTFEAVKAEAAKYSLRTEFQLESPSAYASAHRYGWLDMIGLPARSIKWTFEAVKAEVAKYSTRTEFAQGNRSAYNRARKEDWLDELFP